ncbi:hypothetical protein C8R44DRAFT_346464 [Mycena epipterygia]|nr:hypothetical protein C8R44DRAFT_346464 [Mycena epipterygia]
MSSHDDCQPLSTFKMCIVPLELLRAIASDVDDNSALLTLRLASKTCDSIAKPFAFRMLTVRDNIQSAETLVCLQNCESITNFVQEVVFKADPDGLSSYELLIADPSGEEGRTALSVAFSGLQKFPNLRTLRCDFHSVFQENDTVDVPEEPSHFLRLQFDVFTALAANLCPSLVSLTLNNVIAMPDDIYGEEDFQNIFRSLKTLHISVLSDTDGEGAYYQDPLSDFWEHSITHILVSASNLTSLTLRSDQPVGVGPALPLDLVHMPHLTSLVLHNFVFDPWVALPKFDIVAFIVRHHPTLTRLELGECSVYGGEGGLYVRPWQAILQRFERELLHLRVFRYWPHFSYVILLLGDGYMEDREADDKTQDIAALDSLMSVVEARRSP